MQKLSRWNLNKNANLSVKIEMLGPEENSKNLHLKITVNWKLKGPK